MSGFTDRDREFMARALKLAERGLATTHPNPRVGCVLVKDGRIAAEGWHERAGGPHAEVAALRALAQAGRSSAGCTVYVTLEPCSHHGRTPPCTGALIAARVARVVYAVRDPNPGVDGAGAAQLERAGIRVESGLLQREAEELNAGFMKRMRRGLPWVRLKIAASLDGRTALASGESRWISSADARQDVQHWRARSSAVLTGIGTVLADDPRLTVRPAGAAMRQPLRVVFDSRLRLPVSARLLRAVPDAPAGTGAATPSDPWPDPWPDPGVWVFAAQDGPRRAALEAAGVHVEIAGTPPGRVDLRAALAALARAGVNEVLAECGAILGGALLTDGLVDELLLYVAPLLLGPQARPLAELPPPAGLAAAMRFELVEHCAVGGDIRLRLRPPPAV